MNAVYRIKGIKRARWITLPDGTRKRFLYLRCGHTPDGKEILEPLREKEGTPEFIAEVNAIRERYATGEHLIGDLPGTWGWLVKLYQMSPDFQEIAPKTRQDYQAHLNYLNPLSDAPLSRFTKEEIRRIRDKKYKQARESGRGDGTRSAKYLVQVISKVMQWGMDSGRVTFATNPATGAGKMKRRIGAVKTARERAWTDEEVSRMLQSATGGIRMAVALAVYTGQRQSTVLNMEWDDIRNGRINVKQSKTGAVLSIPIHPELYGYLQESLSFEGRIVRNASGEAYTSDGFRTMYGRVASALKKAGLLRQDMTFHGLRHTAATRLADAGATDREIMAFTGHSQASMVGLYTAGADQKRRADEGMRKLVGEEKTPESLETRLIRFGNSG